MNYLMKSRGIVADASASVVACFKKGLTYRGSLADLPAWALQNQADAPLSCLVGGRRHGLYPCIIAKDRDTAKYLRSASGQSATPGDGVTFATLRQAEAVVGFMRRLGASISTLDIVWGITGQPVTQQLIAPHQQAIRSVPSAMSMEEQLADSPF